MLAKLLERARPAREVKAAVAGWHPDFRDLRKLPDVKVVRTAFFINGALAVAAVLLAGSLAFREWQVREVAGKIVEEERKIARDRPLSEAALKQYQAFRADHARLEEVAAFLAARPSVPRLLRRLGETLPPDLALDGFELREDGLALRFTVRGDALAASGLATRYLEALRGDAAMGAFDQFTFAGTPARNPNTGRVGVEFFLRLRSKLDGKTKAGRKKG
jgi:hypothetical protein